MKELKYHTGEALLEENNLILSDKSFETLRNANGKEEDYRTN